MPLKPTSGGGRWKVKDKVKAEKKKSLLDA